MEYNSRSCIRAAINLSFVRQDEIEQQQTLRKERLRRVCRKIGLGKEENLVKKGRIYNRVKLQQLFTAHAYNVSYCAVPKVGTRFYRGLFANLNGFYNLSSREVLHQQVKFSLASLPMEEIHTSLTKQRTFLFVREPFTRILSAYLDKFIANNKDFEKRFGTEIIRKYRQNATRSSLTKGNDVTFPEFITYLTNLKTRDHVDKHWSRYTSLCHVCHLRYDFIGLFENMATEGPYVLHNIIRINKTMTNWKESRTRHLLFEYYSKIDKKKLRMVREIYRTDAELFGYSVPDSLQPLLAQD